MNERIKLLAEQAGIDFFNSTDPEFFGREYCEAWTEQQQKFAELIVNECAEIADLDRANAAGCGWITKTKGMLIKEHFGLDKEQQ